MQQNLNIMNLKNLFKPTLLVVCLSLFIACSEDEDDLGPGEPNQETYNTEVYVTDAPIDNAEVDAAFVTITGVKINGETIDAFEKTTINLSALQNGETQLLGDVDLEAGTTSEIVLMLDNETDASGEAPGNFILTTSGEKKALVSTSGEINVSENVNIHESSDNQIVLDFDLRKLIAADASGEYRFVSDSKLANSIRAVNTLETGTITGTVTDFGSVNSDALVVFAYEAGAYSESEAEADDEGITFSNAVTSSLVNETNGDFELHFVEDGDYELHFVAFEDTDADGSLEVKGEVEATSATEIDLGGFSVDANSEVDLQIVLLGWLNL